MPRFSARRRIPLNRMAVLFRAGFHSFDLEIELAREGLAFIKVGGFKFTESAHIKDVLAHLRVIANPYDRISWHRILQLIEKVGPRSAQRIYDAIAAADAGVAGLFTIRLKNPGIERLAGLYRAIDPTVMRELKVRQRREGKTLGRLVSELLSTAMQAEVDGPRPPAPLAWSSRPMRAGGSSGPPPGDGCWWRRFRRRAGAALPRAATHVPEPSLFPTPGAVAHVRRCPMPARSPPAHPSGPGFSPLLSLCQAGVWQVRS